MTNVPNKPASGDELPGVRIDGQPKPSLFGTKAAVKTANFLADFGLKSSMKSAVMVMNNASQDYHKVNYHNRRIQNTPKITFNAIDLMINALKRGQIEADNFHLYKVYKLIMPILALFEAREFTTYFCQKRSYAVKQDAINATMCR